MAAVDDLIEQAPDTRLRERLDVERGARVTLAIYNFAMCSRW